TKLPNRATFCELCGERNKESPTRHTDNGSLQQITPSCLDHDLGSARHMSAATRAQAITRWAAVAVMAAAVLTATASGFAQSYAGLYHWALDHGLSGWKAQSFPLLVDLFIIVGELGLFLLAIDAFVLQRRALLSWLDFCLPLTIALAGWTASLIFNVGHVGNKSF